MQNITKLGADHLRAFTYNNHGIKLKATHAHELVAAFFGYQSRAALLADTQYPVSNLRQANIIVLPSTEPIDQRRKRLQDLPSDLPDTGMLAAEICSSLISEKWFLRKLWLTYDSLATFLADEHMRQQKMENIYRSPVREGVKIQPEDDGVRLIVFRFYQLPIVDGGVHEVEIIITIKLQRVAGHIGYANPEISIKIEKLGMRR